MAALPNGVDVGIDDIDRALVDFSVDTGVEADDAGGGVAVGSDGDGDVGGGVGGGRRAGSGGGVGRVARRLKRHERSLWAALRSIAADAAFVAEIAALWPAAPLVANLRCGRWYAREFEASCYFKSTDGHAGNWAFSKTRLNMHVAHLAGVVYTYLTQSLRGCVEHHRHYICST